jgi:hypothetical protein
MERREFIARLGTMVAAQLAPMPAVTQSLSRAERPEIKVGDASVFQDRNVRTGEKRETRFHLIRLDADKIVTETAGRTSGTQTFTRDWNLMEVRTGDLISQTVKPFWPRLRFPLEVGLKWESPFDVHVVTNAASRDAKWKWKAQVVGVEPVTVPGGLIRRSGSNPKALSPHGRATDRGPAPTRRPCGMRRRLSHRAA